MTRRLEFCLLLLLRRKLDVVVGLGVSTARRVLPTGGKDERLVAGSERDVAEIKFLPNLTGILIFSGTEFHAVNERLARFRECSAFLGRGAHIVNGRLRNVQRDGHGLPVAVPSSVVPSPSVNPDHANTR